MHAQIMMTFMHCLAGILLRPRFIWYRAVTYVLGLFNLPAVFIVVTCHCSEFSLLRVGIATTFICSDLPLRRVFTASSCYCDEIYWLRPAIATKFNCDELPVHRLGLHRVQCDEMVLRRAIWHPCSISYNCL